MKSRLLVPFVLAMAAACGGADARTAGRPANGDASIRYEATPDPFPALELVPGADLCNADAGCELTAADIVLPLSTGALVGSRDLILIVDSVGRKTGVLGARGKGPGEYTMVLSIDTSSNGDIRLFDGFQRRIVTFDRNYKHKTTTPIVSPELPEMLTAARLRAGRFFAATIRSSATPSDTGSEVISSGADGTQKLKPITHGRASVSLVGEFGRVVPQFFKALLLWDVDRDGSVYIADGAAYSIRRVGIDGVQQAGIQVDLPPARVTKADIDARLAADADRAAKAKPMAAPPGVRMPANAGMREYSLEGAKNAAEFMPVLDYLRVLDDGTLWIRRYVKLDEDSARWDGFRSNGKPLGSIRLARDALIRAGVEGRVIITDKDSLDLPIVRWYSVRPVNRDQRSLTSGN